MRLKPRFNGEVNDWWMCDAGRYGYKFIDHDRILKPVIRNQGTLQTAGWNDIVEEVIKSLKGMLKKSKDELAVLVSPEMTNEELYLAKKLFVKELGLERVLLLRTKADGDQDDLLIRSDKHPNRKGAEWIGFEESKRAIQEVIDQGLKGGLKGLILFGQDLAALYPGRNVEDLLQRLDVSVFVGSNHNLTSEHVQFILPAATYAEKNGTFTNFQGRVQRIREAIPPAGQSKAESEILTLFADHLKLDWSYENEEQIFDSLRRSVPQFQGMNYSKIGREGVPVE